MQQHFDFILQHRNDDPRDLALRQSRYPDVDIPYVVQQISAWQTAKKKLPLWADTEGIEFPVHLSMEQCSSQLTAEYKASIIPNLDSVTDLTAGFGVDATMFGRKAKHLTYIERNEELCRIANNNLPLLGIPDFEILNADGTELLSSLPHQSLLYLDPARRDEHGGKTVQICDCTPDVTQLQDKLLEKADYVMIKLSPMLDIANVTRELKCIHEIHIVSVDNECKEILVILSKEAKELTTHCINLTKNGQQTFSVHDNEREAVCNFSTEVSTYLYEPNVSIMKAGCFRSLAQTYNVAKLHPSSHLYTSDELCPDFPGRIFRTEAVHTFKDKALKQIKKANLTVRNFPSSVADLRKRLKISEGGDTYLFATTLADESKVIIRCERYIK